MGKINGCLKCLFIFFNVLFEIVGCGLLYAATTTLKTSQISQLGTPSPAWIWVFAFSFLGISSLGIYAACSENTLALKIFAGFMGAGIIIMTIFGIYMAVTKNKVDEVIETIGRTILSDEDLKKAVDELQSTFGCCGILSLDDFQDSIPDTCSCEEENIYSSNSKCKQKPAEASGPRHIYAQTCSDLFKYYMNLIISSLMGFFFGFAAIALMGLLISLLMIHQIKKHEGAGVAMPMKSY